MQTGKSQPIQNYEKTSVMRARPEKKPNHPTKNRSGPRRQQRKKNRRKKRDNGLHKKTEKARDWKF